MPGKTEVKLVFKLHHDRQRIFQYCHRSVENGCAGQTKGFISLFMIRGQFRSLANAEKEVSSGWIQTEMSLGTSAAVLMTTFIPPALDQQKENWALSGGQMDSQSQVQTVCKLFNKQIWMLKDEFPFLYSIGERPFSYDTCCTKATTLHPALPS